MRPPEILSRLGGFTGRGPGSDAERRAAGWLATQLRQTGREVTIEAFWCRPNWALAHAWHAAAALAGSLLSVASQAAGVALLAIVLLSTVADALLGVSLGRRLTPERASQNVIATPPADPAGIRSRLIITANYDAGRMGLAYRRPLRTVAAWLRGTTRRVTPGWLGWLCVAI